MRTGSDKPNREIAVYAIKNKRGETYFLLRERGKPDTRVPIATGCPLPEAFRDLIREHGPATFTLMNDVGPNFSKDFRISALDDLLPLSDKKQ